MPTQVHTPGLPIQWKWISQIGPDALDFLHRLTTVHVRNLDVGQGAPGFFLTAQGKVRAQFTLWRYGDAEFAFEFDAGTDAGWKRRLLEVIDQFTFAEKFVLADVADSESMRMECRWVFPTGATAGDLENLKAFETRALDGEMRACHHGNVDFGRPWMTIWGREGTVDAWIAREFSGAITPVSFEDLERERIAQVRPSVDREITEDLVPLEAGMRDAIADNKGCYPGQEVIERIISIGSPARRLARIDGPIGGPIDGPIGGPIDGSGSALPFPGNKLVNQAEPPVEVGEITSVIGTASGFSALAWVRKIHAKEGLNVAFKQGEQVSGSGTIAKVSPFN